MLSGYRVFVYDADNHIVTRNEFHCATDAEAVSMAKAWIAAENHRAAVEVWQRKRMVYRFEPTWSPEPRRSDHRARKAVRALRRARAQVMHAALSAKYAAGILVAKITMLALAAAYMMAT